MNERVDLSNLSPDWQSLGKPLKRSIKDAVLLSLNIVPNWEGYIKHLSSKIVLQINFDYVPRVNLAKEWALQEGFLVNLKPTSQIEEQDLVYIPKFAQWAITKQGWVVPLEFRDLAENLDAQASRNVLELQPIPKQVQQQDVILKIIQDLGFDALNLPKFEAGKPSLKADVRKIATQNKKLFGSNLVFDKAWERCRKDGTISQKN